MPIFYTLPAFKAFAHFQARFEKKKYNYIEMTSNSFFVRIVNNIGFDTTGGSTGAGGGGAGGGDGNGKDGTKHMWCTCPMM